VLQVFVILNLQSIYNQRICYCNVYIVTYIYVVIAYCVIFLCNCCRFFLVYFVATRYILQQSAWKR